ncbi:hypothetical protein IFU30_10995 [Plantibacter sp. CFBP 8798]|uniref:hypothetical protein n=1 Tax=Plantibacter sp. CFBP 8798 TaxID=2775268 RepID=UPI00177C6134|nr:hypothetical protein [Plantibacter sp. CFBP 8798]MBD8466794.1 hypothetical protein [Plantibacter sp. CFBP 8798]
MTATALLKYVNGSSSDLPFAETCWDQASALVSQHVRSAVVPDSIVERATLEVGSELYHRRQAPNGIATFGGMDGGQAIRVARDPMVGAYPILAPFLGLGFA